MREQMQKYAAKPIKVYALLSSVLPKLVLSYKVTHTITLNVNYEKFITNNK